ncbi:MAG: Uncharacterized protein G01um101448_1152 [Parcubacteria group bacterium Gr01-1014_48]|nr:MAG: Uncharacterized protein G01um101448_1152 [Parcubacteria group bacterium Gr01-1014_48]
MGLMLQIFNGEGARRIKMNLKHTFISGIPTSGKSFLAAKIAREHHVFHVDMDELRVKMAKDSELKKWVEFFADQDEEQYWKSTNCEQDWQNLVRQSEAFWPTFLKKISDVIAEGKPAVFESVNILPHLAKRDLSFPGIYLLGESFGVTFQRNKEDSRWGKTKALQQKEAEMFFYCEGEMYHKEAERCGYKTFRDITLAEREVLSLLSS